MTNQTRTFSSVAKERRRELGMSQELLSWIARVSRSTVSKIERGGASDPEGLVFDRLNAALGLRTAFYMDGTIHEDAGDDIAFVDAQILAWFVDMFETMRGTDEDMARKAADLYVDFMDTLADIQEGAARPSVRQAVAELADDLMATMRPFMTSGLSEGPLLDFLREAGWSPEDRPREATVTGLPALRGSFQGSISEVESLRERLHESEERRTMAEMHVASLRHEVGRLANELTEVRAGASGAQAFARLPVQAQLLLREGHVRDWSVIPGRGMQHVRLTVQEKDAEPATAAEVMDQAVLVDYALMASMVLIKRMREHNWDYRNIMPDMPVAVDAVAQDLRAVIADWFEELVGQDGPASVEGA